MSVATSAASVVRIASKSPAALPKIIPTGGPLGAFVADIDAGARQTAAAILELKQALREHQILIFKNQGLTDQQLRDFATYFGTVFAPPGEVPVLASGEDGRVPDVVLVANVDGGYTGSGELAAHIDHQWTPLPSAGSLLYAVEIPRQGGDTHFINTALAYEGLDAETRREIDELELITYNPFLRKQGDPRPRYRDLSKPPHGPGFPHPLVRTHPDSGRRHLYLSDATEVEVLGYGQKEGEDLIERLREHLRKPEHRYAHKWSVGDIVYWDNQAVLHYRPAFDPNERRVLKRVSLAGSRPF